MIAVKVKFWCQGHPNTNDPEGLGPRCLNNSRVRTLDIATEHEYTALVARVFRNNPSHCWKCNGKVVRSTERKLLDVA